MRKMVLLGSVLALSAALACGCSSTTTLTKNEATNVSDDQPELVMKTGWADVQADYAALDAQAQEKAQAISGDGMAVRQQVYDIIDEIEDNIPTVVAAAESGDIDDAAVAAMQTIYVDGVALESLGEQDTTDVGLYISDLGHDAQWLVANVYNGDVANVDLAQSEVDENYDKIRSFDEDRDHDANPVENETAESHWNEFAQRIGA